MIYYFKPYDTRGLGIAYNRHCALLPKDDDWACIFDTDTMIFSSQRIQEVLESVIAKFHPTYAAFTCVTNRAYSNSLQQLRAGIRNEQNLVNLKRRADWQMANRVDLVGELRTNLNGQFILLPKSLWLKFPFADVGRAMRGGGHHILGIDTEWHNRLRANGLKLGLIHQLMTVHFYRMDDRSEHVGHLPGGLEWHAATAKKKAVS